RAGAHNRLLGGRGSRRAALVRTIGCWEGEAPAEPRWYAQSAPGRARLLPSRAGAHNRLPGGRGSCRAALVRTIGSREGEAPAEPRWCAQSARPEPRPPIAKRYRNRAANQVISVAGAAYAG